MILMALKANEKFAFLQLAHFLARVDGKFGDTEKSIIDSYCLSMGIENSDFFDVNDFDLELTLKQFKSLESRKIVVLSLMILIHIDDTFDKKEYELIKEIMKNFKLEEKYLVRYSSWGKAVSALYEQSKNFIYE